MQAKFANAKTLGPPNSADVFATAAVDIANITSSTELAQRLTLLEAPGTFVKGPFAVIKFDAPASGIATPVFRGNLGFVKGGVTAGGAREFVIPNMEAQQLSNVTTRFIS